MASFDDCYREHHCQEQNPRERLGILASAIAGLFARFRYLSAKEQYDLADRVFVAFDVNEDGSVEKAVMRGEILSQICGTNGRQSSATK